MDKEQLKAELANYKITPEERSVVRYAMFNFITLATVGAASLGIATRSWARSRYMRTGIPTILGTFTGLSLGGALGMDRGMHKLRDTLPADSKLLELIRKNDKVNKQKDQPIIDRIEQDFERQEPTTDTDIQLELIEDQLSKEE